MLEIIEIGHLHRFATYTGARIEELLIRDDSVHWVVSDRQYRLEMEATRAQGGLLLGPTRVEMGKRVAETLNASVQVRLARRTGGELFQGTGRFAGLEVHGALEKLLALSAWRLGSIPDRGRPSLAESEDFELRITR